MDSTASGGWKRASLDNRLHFAEWQQHGARRAPQAVGGPEVAGLTGCSNTHNIIWEVIERVQEIGGDAVTAERGIGPPVCKSCGCETRLFQRLPSTGELIVRCPKCGGFFTYRLGASGQYEPVTLNSSRPEPRDQLVGTRAQKQLLPERDWTEVFDGLAAVKEDYVRRDVQIRFAEAVAQAIRERQILFIEAGVGTGKTFGYLIPALMLSGLNGSGPIVVSTATKSLQEQLYYKDLPLLKRFFEITKRPWAEPLLSKGRQNYVCLKRLDQFRPTRDELIGQLEQIKEWEKNRSQYGDFEEPGAPRVAGVVRENIQVTSCSAECPYEARCRFKTMYRKRRSWMGLIVTNHNQLIQDLANRKEGQDSGLWPWPSLVIVDEAHVLSAVTRVALQTSVGLKEVDRFLERAHSLLRRADYSCPKWDSTRVGAGIRRLLGQAVGASSTMRRYAIDCSDGLTSEIAYIRSVCEETFQNLDILSGMWDTRLSPAVESQLESLLEGGESLVKRLRKLEDFLRRADSENEALWVEEDNQRDLAVVLAPLDVGGALREILWSQDVPVVVTSGTLAVRGSFLEVYEELGVPYPSERVTNVILPSSFDYAKRCRVYLPTDLPSPRKTEGDEIDEEFSNAIADRIHRLLVLSSGRALVLFTNYDRLDYVYKRLKETGLPFKLLKQGDAGPGELLEVFREDRSSVLLATGAFWEGVDVAGDALSMVVMDKLPFPNPQDPLIKGLAERIRASGQEPFRKLFLPLMLRALKQGSGRLIREDSDWGLIALLDTRARLSQYEDLVRAHLPPCPWLTSLDEVCTWFTHGPEA